MKYIKINEFIKNVVKIVTGDLIVKIIGFLSIAILARLYSPSDFGILELAVSIQLISLTFASMKYEQAVMIPKSDSTSFNLLSLSIIILSISSLLFLILFFIIKIHFANFESIKKIDNLIFFVPLLIFLRGLKDNITFWFSRKKRFGRSAISEIFNKLGEVTFKISLSALGVYGLFIGNTLGLIASLIILIYYLIKLDKLKFQDISAANILSSLSKYKKFPLYLLPSHLFRIISERLPAILLTPFFGFEIVGYYAISFKLFNEPMSILGKSIGNVFYQEASTRHSEQKDIQNLVYQVFEKLIIVSFLPILFLTISGKLLITIFLGNSWITAGYYTQLLAPMMFFRFISNPMSFTFNIFDKQNYDMIFNALLLVSGLFALLIGGFYKNIDLALTLFSIANSVIYFSSIIIVLVLCKISLQKIIRGLFLPFFLALVSIFIFILLTKFYENSIYQIIFCVLISIIYYLILLTVHLLNKR